MLYLIYLIDGVVKLMVKALELSDNGRLEKALVSWGLESLNKEIFLIKEEELKYVGCDWSCTVIRQMLCWRKCIGSCWRWMGSW